MGDDWLNDFEGRHPDGNTDPTRLAALSEWLVSTDQSAATGNTLATPITYGEVTYTEDTAEYRLAKFKNEFTNLLNLDSALFYYLFTELFLMVDSRAKNAFPTLYNGDKWCWLPYDMDTAIGTNNEGALAFSYELEDIDKTETGADVYNGQDSVMWINLRQAFPKELEAMYQKLRSDNVISYPIVEKRFEDHQAIWPEAIFNEDSFYKYLEPLFEDNTAAYLGMLQGSKAEQRKWWLYNRFKYIDSKYNAGDAMSDFITLRGYAKDDITVRPYADIYATIKYGSYLVQKRALRGASYTLECPLDNVNDTEIYIYSSSQLADVGDLSGLKVGYAEFAKATKLQSLKLGDASEDYSNTNLVELYLGNNELLKTLDVRNCPNLGKGDKQQSVDLSGCINIEEVYFDGTAITGVSLPNGGILKTLHLPETITNLSIMNQKLLKDFTIPSYRNITTLRLENNSDVINPIEILNQIAENSRVRILGFNVEANSVEELQSFLNKLDTMRGLDEKDNTLATAQVKGTIYVPTITSKQLYEFNQKYPDITIEYGQVILYKVNFYTGTTLLQTVENLSYLDRAEYTGETPQKTGVSIPEDYQFSHWTPEPIANEDTDCYAQFDFIGSYARYLVERTIMDEYTNNRLATVGASAFQGCTLLTSVSLPNCTTVGNNLFNGCTALTSVSIPNIQTVSVGMFNGCTKLVSYDIPRVTRIEENGFTSTPITSIPNEENITFLGNCAFWKATKLTKVRLPKIETLDGRTFLDCSGLVEADIGDKSTFIDVKFGWNVFGASGLTTLILRATTMLKLPDYRTFNGTPLASGTGYIYVPSALINSYKTATNWSTYADQFRAIEDYPEICGGDM